MGAWVRGWGSVDDGSLVAAAGAATQAGGSQKALTAATVVRAVAHETGVTCLQPASVLQQRTNKNQNPSERVVGSRTAAFGCLRWRFLVKNRWNGPPPLHLCARARAPCRRVRIALDPIDITCQCDVVCTFFAFGSFLWLFVILAIHRPESGRLHDDRLLLAYPHTPFPSRSYSSSLRRPLLLLLLPLPTTPPTPAALALPLLLLLPLLEQDLQLLRADHTLLDAGRINYRERDGPAWRVVWPTFEILVNPSIHPSINQSINPSINQSINQSIHPSINQSIKEGRRQPIDPVRHPN